MTEIPTKIIREWFILRFSKMPEHDKAYYNEWKRRFKDSGEQAGISHMDLQSQRMWEKVKSAHKMKQVI